MFLRIAKSKVADMLSDLFESSPILYNTLSRRVLTGTDDDTPVCAIVTLYCLLHHGLKN